MLKTYLAEQKVSIYRLSKNSGIPYSTLNDIVNQKVDIKNVKAGIVFSLAECLNLSMNQLYTLCCNDMTVDSQKYQIQGTIHVKNKIYYVSFEYHGQQYTKELCPVKKEATLFIQDISVWEMEKLISEIEMEEAYALYVKTAR